MTTIEYLHQPGMIRQEIARKIVRIENLRRYAARLTAPVREVEVQSTPDPARMQAFLSEVADTEKEIDDLRKILEKTLDEIALYLSFLSDPLMHRVMELRYLNCLDWNQIAWQVGYYPTSVYRVHRRALKLLPPPPGAPDET